MPALAQWTGTPSIKGSSESMRMALLTASLIGLQFTWGVEMTYCTPYLLALGLSKARISLVWIAGPLSGLIMQPIVGVIADRSTSRFGRRRPFMVLGTIAVSACLLVLGWTKEVVEFVYGAAPENASKAQKEAVKSATIALAVVAIYAIDFAINAVQASCRSLVVDTLPIPKQQQGSSWASRMVAIGHLMGYGAGALDLTTIFGGWLGDTQFKQLCAVAAIALSVTVGLTSWAVSERVLVLQEGSDEKQQSGIGAVDMLKKILSTAVNLPRGIAAICLVQFWCWIGWFPFLFYSTTWVGEVYLRYNAPVEAKNSDDMLAQVGRIGSTALIAFSTITLIMSVLLPWFVKSPEEGRNGFTPRPPAGVASYVAEVEKYKPTLLTAWTIGQCVFAGSMIMAPFVTSLRGATVLVSMCGISWAIQCWAPFTFMGIEINRLSGQSGGSYQRLERNSMEMERPDSPDTLRLNHSPDEPPNSASTGEGSGIYLGILNLYTTLPQFVGTFISWIVFSVLEPGKSPELATEAPPEEHHDTEGYNAIAVCLFIGALSVCLAAVQTRRLGRISKY